MRLTKGEIQRAGVERVPRTDDAENGKIRLEDGQAVGIESVIWATGFRPKYDWIDLPAVQFDENGYPIHDRGMIEAVSGLYFLGLPYQYTPVSATIGGVGKDARYVAGHLNELDHRDRLPDDKRSATRSEPAETK